MPNVMAAQTNIGGAVCESSVIPFLVPRHKVWLTAAAGVPCSNAANIGERKTQRTQSEFFSPGDGQRSCKVLLASGERRRCSNEAKKRNQLKFAVVPQTPERISAVSGPKFTILWET